MQESPKHRSPLSSALRAVADDDAGRGVSPVVGARLRSLVREIAATRRRHTVIQITLAAAIVLSVVIPTVRLLVWGRPDTTAARQAAVPVEELRTAFFPLVYGTVPADEGHVVRIEVPRATLATFGLASFETGLASRETVVADVL